MNDIVSETERAALWSNFPAGAVAIASNGAGDLLILLPSSDDLQFWDHETGSVSAVSVCWL
jgi:hypothetical protein